MPRLPDRDLDHVVECTNGELWKALAGSRLFITGGTGFVGKWLLESLLYANDRLKLDVRATVLTRDPARFQGECPHLCEDPAITLLGGDVRNFEFPGGKFGFVIHAATQRQFKPDGERPAGAFDGDVEGTRRVLEFAGTHGTRRFLFTSSGAVYGTQPPELTHIPEDYAGAPLTTDPKSAYGQGKRVSEFLCSMYAQQYGFSALIARLFAFVGPHLPLNQNFAIGNFIADVLAQRPIHIKGDGTPYRSYLYAADLAVWLWTVLVQGVSGRPYNVGSESAMTISDLAETVARVTASGNAIERAEMPVAGTKAARYVPSVQRAVQELRLRSIIPLEEGIRRLYSWADGKSATCVEENS